ncbi:hypothetical protein HBI80_206460 [Parastagonospora nodorum]|nr:hypothetical protein HBH49_208490 [Parastagonospora nodorum]KAH4116397.1 hypothetical protein HBH47_169370 [Parastagonospora nodorum]KAH4183908.1 hypothetical protein HBH42_200600 [Parastagonospora nodorum]KAH4896465.1 hypothetical protein HBI80_206460 [Parastagonospora nodorum]KAH5990096.1 hypothetical protein HBI84_179580 [Parastagonospora nodorum]
MKRDALPLDDFLDAGHFGQSWHMPDDEMARIQLAGTKSSLMRDVTLRKGNWDMGWNTFALYTVLSQKTHHALPRAQSNRRTAGLVMTTGGCRPRCGRVFQDLVQALSRPHNRESMLGRCVACGYWLTHDPTCPLVLQTKIVPRAQGRVTEGRRVACPSRRKQGFSLRHYSSLHRGGSVRTTESELHLLCDAS